MASNKFASHQFTILLSVLSLVILILFGLFAQYSGEALPTALPNVDLINRNAPLLHDTHALILIGFGFLVTFLRRYGYSAIAINLFLVAFVLEFALLVRGFLSDEFSRLNKFSIGLRDLAKADYTAAAVLISYGALVGKLTPVQYLVLALIETPVSILNEHLVLSTLGVGDIGGTIVVHFFGAIFGIVVARIVFKPIHTHSEHQGSVYHSDIFSFIGTVFLWAFWPSFNSIFTITSAEQNRAVLNTFLALAGSTLTTFLFSQIVHKDRKFNIKHIASASLAGGVASGVVCNLILVPWIAILTGILAGAISVIGFHIITPKLATKLNIHDTRGVFSLHGLPAIVGTLVSVFALFLIPVVPHGERIRNIYPYAKTDTVAGRHAGEQALFQLAGLGITFIIAAIAGVITGLILRLKVLRQVREKEYYSDLDFFDAPVDFDFTSRIISHIDKVEVTEYTERTKLTSATNNEPVV